MMKKLVFFVIIFIILFFSMPMIGKGEENIQQDDYQVIPDEAIRLRILANSDSEADQALKREVRDQVNEEISKWVEDITDIDEACERIQSTVPDIEAIVADVLADQKNGANLQVEHRKNLTFPMKIYGSYLSPAGEHEAVLITVGKGDGANWWCVLFPPLCFLAFS